MLDENDRKLKALRSVEQLVRQTGIHVEGKGCSPSAWILAINLVTRVVFPYVTAADKQASYSSVLIGGFLVDYRAFEVATFRAVG